MTPEDIKELIYNAELDYTNINIKDGRVKGYITVLVNDEEFKELSDIPYFYLDEFELDINRYYESAGLTLLNENVKEVFPDVEFQFRKEAAWMIDITKMTLEELEEFVSFLRDSHEIINELNEKYDQEQILKDLYHENP